MAGVDWPEDAEFWPRTLRSAWPDLQQMSVLNDVFAPIRCGEPSGVAVAVTAGTGSAIAGGGRGAGRAGRGGNPVTAELLAGLVDSLPDRTFLAT